MIRTGNFSPYAFLGMICLLLMSSLAPAYAASSPGCEALNSGGSMGLFYAGDRIQMDVIIYSAGPFQPQLYYNGESRVIGEFLSPDDEARLVYTVPSTGMGEVFGVLVGPGSGLDYDIEFSCAADSIDTSNNDDTVSATLTPPDQRLNWRMGDNLAVMYPAVTADGEPRLDVYCYLDGQGILAFSISEPQVAAADLSANAVSLAAAQQCDAEFYVLPNGEVQLNISTPEGKLYEIICQDLACIDPTMRFTDPNQ